MADPTADPQIFQLLKDRINRYFEEAGKNRKGDAAMYIKIAIVGLVPVLGYTLLIAFGDSSLPIAFVAYLLYFLGCALFVVNIAHDASHGAISTKKSVNKLLSFSWNIVGISKYLWEIKHHHSHHIYTNIPHEDVDIAESPLLRFSASYPYKNYYRFQHIYAIPLYGLFGIFIVFVKDFVLLYGEKMSDHGTRNLPRFFLARMLLTKSVFLLVSFIIPLLVLPYAWWQVLIMYLVSMAVAGGMMLLVLVVPHINETATLDGTEPDIHNRNVWVLHQISCTIDSSPESRVLGWLSGGLNTHLIHHIFPNICHIHYIPLTRIIKETLEANGIRYKQKSFGRSLVDHFKYIKALGQPASVVKRAVLLSWLFDFIRDVNL